MDYGCYKDERDDRDLDAGIWQWDTTNTVEECVMHCHLKGAKYAGLQNGAWCVCGDKFGKHGVLTSSACNVACPGDDTQNCGGEWANRIYGTAVIGEIIAPNEQEPFVADKYVGCYRDVDYDRALDGALTREYGTNSVEDCIDSCKKQEYE